MRLRVDWRSSLSLTGTVLKWLPVALALPLAVAIYDAQDVIPFLASVVISGVVGLGLEGATPDPTLDHRDAFLTVALIWLGIGLLGSIPFVMADAGTLAHPVNAAFESMSGITTTGATVIRDFDVHSRAIMLWRAILQWVGGLGILLLTIGLLAKLRIGGAPSWKRKLNRSPSTNSPRISDRQRG